MKAIWQRCVQYRPSPSFRELGIWYPTELASSAGIHKTLHISESRDVNCLGRSGRWGRHVKSGLVDFSVGQTVEGNLLKIGVALIQSRTLYFHLLLLTCHQSNILAPAHQMSESSTTPDLLTYACFGRRMRRLETARVQTHHYKPARMSKPTPCAIRAAAWKCRYEAPDVGYSNLRMHHVAEVLAISMQSPEAWPIRSPESFPDAEYSRRIQSLDCVTHRLNVFSWVSASSKLSRRKHGHPNNDNVRGAAIQSRAVIIAGDMCCSKHDNYILPGI